MQSNGSRNHHRIQSRAVQQVVEIPLPFHIRIQRPEMFQPLFADIAHHFETAVRERSEIANQIGPPITTADDTNFDLLIHDCLRGLYSQQPTTDTSDVSIATQQPAAPSKRGLSKAAPPFDSALRRAPGP